jgi:hypothetical protein
VPFQVNGRGVAAVAACHAHVQNVQVPLQHTGWNREGVCVVSKCRSYCEVHRAGRRGRRQSTPFRNAEFKGSFDSRMLARRRSSCVGQPEPK